MAALSSQSEDSMGNILSKYDSNIDSTGLDMFSTTECIILVNIWAAYAIIIACVIPGTLILRPFCAMAMLNTHADACKLQ